MQRPILVANWKNHPNSLTEAKTLLKGLSANRALYKKTSLFVAPPWPYFEFVSEKIGGYASLASQDIAIGNETTTGSVTAGILKSFGTKLAIIGHSEKRALGETSGDVSKKLAITLDAGIVPLVCVGEPMQDEDGEHFEFLREELKLSLSSLTHRADAHKLVIAYEPIWAIGKGAEDAIAPSELAQSVIFIRKVVTDMFGSNIASSIPILYGGSVEASNVAALMRETGVRGFLVGHASLRAKSFKEIAESLIVKK